MLTVLFCTDEIGYEGGIGRVNLQILQHLDRSIFYPELLIMDKTNQLTLPPDFNAPILILNDDFRFESMVKVMRDVDIVHFTTGFYPTIFEAARSAKVPVLVEANHNLLHGQTFPNIDATICVSKLMQDMQLIPSKTVYIPNGVDLRQFEFKSGKKPSDKIIFLEACRRGKQMYFHLDELANDILAIDPRIELWLAGNDQIGTSTDRVKFLGLRTDMEKLYGMADILVNLSCRESFGLVAIEAMACGCLPLCSNDGAMIEIIENNRNGWLVNGDNPTQIVSTIKRIIRLHDDAYLWEMMRNAARNRVENNFSLQNMVQKLQELYLMLIKKKGRRQSLGPLCAPVTVYAEIGEAIYLYSKKMWQRFEDRLYRIIAHPEPILNLACHTILQNYAQQALSLGKKDLHDMVQLKLTNSKIPAL